jgi:hypothetical protein
MDHNGSRRKEGEALSSKLYALNSRLLNLDCRL